MLLLKNDIESHFKSLSHYWTLNSKMDRLYFRKETQSFNEGLQIANMIGKIADELWHHPELTIKFKSLELEMTTHDKNGLTKLDYKFAEELDKKLNL